MGNCCSTNNYDKLIENITRDEHESWFRGNINFEEFVYKKYTPRYENLTFQTIIAKDWVNIDLEYMKSDDSDEKKYFELLKTPIMKGVPNYLIRDVIFSIFFIDESVAHSEYVSLCEMIGDTSKLYIQPFFGRRNLTNLFLTKRGKHSCRRLLYILSLSHDNIELSLILPRIVQILLWFLNEHEVYEVVSLLLKDKKYFPMNLEQHKTIASFVKRKASRVIFQDIVFNLGIGYVRPCYYPQLLCYFLAEGIIGVMKFAFAILQQHINVIYRIEKDFKDPHEIISNFKQISVSSTSISRVLTQAHSVHLKFSNVENNCVIDYYVPFEEQSAILTSNPKTIKHFYFLPIEVRKMKVNLLKINSFLELLGAKGKAFLVLCADIDANVFGIFIDRPLGSVRNVMGSQCALVNYSKKKTFNHKEGCVISLVIDQEFSLVSGEKAVLSISSNMKEAVFYSSYAFEELSFPERVSISVLEVFEFSNP